MADRMMRGQPDQKKEYKADSTKRSAAKSTMYREGHNALVNVITKDEEAAKKNLANKREAKATMGAVDSKRATQKPKSKGQMGRKTSSFHSTFKNS